MKDHEVLEDILKVKEEEEKLLKEDDKRKIPRIFYFLIGLFLALLIISFIFVTFPIGDIIEGQIESNPVKNNVIELDDFKIIFEVNSLKKLQSIYFDEQELEFSVCLLGEKDKNIYNIHDLYQPVMYQQTFSSVIFEPCSEESLIILHSHPYKSCVASQTDLNMLRQNKQRNPDVLMVVMCQADRFSVYK